MGQLTASGGERSLSQSLFTPLEAAKVERREAQSEKWLCWKSTTPKIGIGKRGNSEMAELGSKSEKGCRSGGDQEEQT
jgi:hypothetical protein